MPHKLAKAINTMAVSLNHSNDADWEFDGVPNLAAIQAKLKDDTITAGDVAEAAPKVRRGVMGATASVAEAAPVQAPAEAPAPEVAPVAPVAQVTPAAAPEAIGPLTPAAADAAEPIVAEAGGEKPDQVDTGKSAAELVAERQVLRDRLSKLDPVIDAAARAEAKNSPNAFKTPEQERLAQVKQVQAQTQAAAMKRVQATAQVSEILKANGYNVPKNAPSLLDAALASGQRRSAYLSNGHVVRAPSPRSPEGIANMAKHFHQKTGRSEVV